MLSFKEYGLMLEQALKNRNENRGEFVRRLIYSLIDIDADETSDCDNVSFSEYENDTWKAYLSRRSISNIANDILKHYDPVDFTNLINNLEGNAVSILRNKLQPYIDNLNIYQEDLPTICDKIMYKVLMYESENAHHRQRNRPNLVLNSISTIDNNQRCAILNQMRSFVVQTKPSFFISYSCTNFNKPKNPIRITAIVVNQLNTSCEKAFDFSIYNKKLKENLSESDKDLIEFKLLDNFFEFAIKYRNSTWIHWNMRNSKYGFEVLCKRYLFLGGKLPKKCFVHEFDMAWAFKRIYGDDYIDDPRLENISKLNNLTLFDFENGINEPTLFENGEYDRLTQSRQRKVHCMASLFNKAIHDTLKIKQSLVKE